MPVSDKGLGSVHIGSAADNQVHRVTDTMFNAFGPTWDPQGNYLYYLSTREFAPQISNIEFNYATNRDSFIYAVALRKDVKHPFPPESDEVSISKETPKAEGQPAEAKDKPAGEAKPDAARKPADTTIDFDGTSARVARVPLGADNYGGSSAKSGHLLYATGPAFYY